jgi:hypothetical protein
LEGGLLSDDVEAPEEGGLIAVTFSLSIDITLVFNKGEVASSDLFNHDGLEVKVGPPGDNGTVCLTGAGDCTSEYLAPQIVGLNIIGCQNAAVLVADGIRSEHNSDPYNESPD